MSSNPAPVVHRLISAGTLLWLLLAGASQTSAQPSPPEAPQRGEAEYRLSFLGRIDGSEIIEISDTHAWWTHRNWGWPPHGVWLGNVQWNPKHGRSLENAGRNRYLPAGLDFSRARLSNVRARDKVTLEPGPRSVRLRIVDTPNGAGHYAFDIVFPVRFRRTAVRITADIDGSDTLTLTRNGAEWKHHRWAWPNRVLIDDVAWQPKNSPQLKKNQWSLPKGVDLSAARLTVHRARDAAVMEAFKDRVVIHFADNPLGRATCDLTIDWPLPRTATQGDSPLPPQTAIDGNYRFRLFQGDPRATGRGSNKLIAERTVPVDSAFQLKGPQNTRFTGRLWSDKAGGLIFKGTATYSGGKSEMNSMLKPGQPLRSSSGAGNGKVIPYFAEFTRLQDDDTVRKSTR